MFHLYIIKEQSMTKPNKPVEHKTQEDTVSRTITIPNVGYFAVKKSPLPVGVVGAATPPREEQAQPSAATKTPSSLYRPKLTS